MTRLLHSSNGSKLLFPAQLVTLPIHGNPSQEFPIHRIYCIGRNYREHALEMGHIPPPKPKPSQHLWMTEEPFHFSKPASAATTSPFVPYPSKTNQLHFEGELVVAIGKSSHDYQFDDLVSQQSLESQIDQMLSWAHGLIYGYALGCDLTRRDLQNDAKKLSRPWDASKGFEFSAPMTCIVPKEALYDFTNDTKDTTCPVMQPTKDINSFQIFLQSEIQLWVNDELRQSSPLNQMIWSIPELIVYLARYYTLMPGDLIWTGTPAGVGPLLVGDQVRIQCGTVLPPCSFQMVSSTGSKS